MLNIGAGELLVILLVALIVIGPTKLPDAVRQVSRAIGQFKRISGDFQREFQSAIDAPMKEIRDTIDEPMKELRDAVDLPTEQEARKKGRNMIADSWAHTPKKDADDSAADEPAADDSTGQSPTDEASEAAEPAEATEPAKATESPDDASEPLAPVAEPPPEAPPIIGVVPDLPAEGAAEAGDEEPQADTA